MQNDRSALYRCTVSQQYATTRTTKENEMKSGHDASSRAGSTAEPTSCSLVQTRVPQVGFESLNVGISLTRILPKVLYWTARSPVCVYVIYTHSLSIRIRCRHAFAVLVTCSPRSKFKISQISVSSPCHRKSRRSTRILILIRRYCCCLVARGGRVATCWWATSLSRSRKTVSHKICYASSVAG